MKNLFYITCCMLIFLGACKQNSSEEKVMTPISPMEKTAKAEYISPDILYGDLFKEIQMTKVFPDGKTFVDCTPKQDAKVIMEAYQVAKEQADFNLKDFVLAHFDLPIQYASGFKADTTKSVQVHIDTLWSILLRKPDQETKGSLISLPNSYIVPGGRFGEIYYWDSYFTMLGLQQSGRTDIIENMVDNFSYLIENIGFIPNGNRSYFLTRSQPPFFALMVGLLAEQKGEEIYVKYLPILEKEYDFWMSGNNESLSKASAVQHVVALPKGQVLNRYWDSGTRPRAESYKEDVELVEHDDRPDEIVYQHLRAACESGWDFSSRWLKDGQSLYTIHTMDILPVDLNALLYHLEKTIAHGYELKGEEAQKKKYEDWAQKRKTAFSTYHWDKDHGFFMDYDFVAQQFTDKKSLAGVYPLFLKMANQEQADQVAKMIKEEFLKPGGVVSTLAGTGEQWDSPNGWAPLQWMTIKGLRNYGHDDLANEIKQRWTTLNKKVYKNTGKLVEKYNVMDISLEAGGGEYPVQDGFGWTNGVLLKLLEE